MKDLFTKLPVNLRFPKRIELKKMLFGTEKEQNLVLVVDVNELTPEQREEFEGGILGVFGFLSDRKKSLDGFAIIKQGNSYIVGVSSTRPKSE